MRTSTSGTNSAALLRKVVGGSVGTDILVRSASDDLSKEDGGDREIHRQALLCPGLRLIYRRTP